LHQQEQALLDTQMEHMDQVHGQLLNQRILITITNGLYLVYLDKLQQLYRQLNIEYHFYKSGTINQKEYLRRVNPIDVQITQLEMSTLQDTLAWREASSLHTQKRVC